MKISKRFIGFYLSFLFISTVCFDFIFDPTSYTTIADWVFDSLFYYLDYFLLGAYMLVLAFREPSFVRSPALLKLYGLSYLFLFSNTLIVSTFIQDLYELDSYAFIGNLFIRAFQIIVFIFLAKEIKKTKRFVPAQFWISLMVTFVLLGFFNIKSDLEWIKGLNLCLLLVAYIFTILYLSNQKKELGRSLVIAVVCLAITELYFALLFFDSFQVFIKNRDYFKFMDLAVIFRLFGSLCELWLVYILLKSYFPKVAIR